MPRRKTLEDKIQERISRKRDDVYLPREFFDLGSKRQVQRALRRLGEQGKLIRLGYGVYGRAEISQLTGQPMLAGDGFGSVARRALDKLKVKWEPTQWERDYNEGRSTQVPMTPRVRLRSKRFARKIRYRTMELTFER